MNPHADVRRVQNNILITQDGQACLGDFAIAWLSTWTSYVMYHRPETLRHMAPERFLNRPHTPPLLERLSKDSDVYSLAMTAFSVCTLLETTLRLNTMVLLQSGLHRRIAISRK